MGGFKKKMSRRPPSSPPIKRVPPPPPPGFGDEDYYRLYGRPEEYHQKRQKFERAERSPSFQEDHEEYYYYRRSHRKSYEEEYDYYSSRRSSNRPRPVHQRLSKKRSYYNEVHGDPRPSTSSQPYKHFQVDMDNESEGTPSLSGEDTDADGSKASSVETDNSSINNSDSETEERLDNRRRRPRRPPPRQHQKKGKSGEMTTTDLYKNRKETYRAENEKMQKKLDRKHKRTSVSDKNMALAKLAGIDMIPSRKPRLKQRKQAQSSRLRIGGMESSTRDGKRGRILMSRSRSKSPAAAGTSNNRKRKNNSSLEKWSHDKFDENRDSNEAEKDASPASASGSHWSQNRREKSKEQSRRRQRSGSSSRSRSSSSSHSSRSSSSSDRSISRRRRRRRRRRSYSSSSSVSSGSSRSSGSVRRQLQTHREERRKAEAKKQANNVPLALREEKQNVKAAVTAVDDNRVGDQEEKVDMSLSGNLLKDTNTVNGVVVRYAEPTDGRKPKTKWRMYVFKGEEELPILYVHRQSSYLLGRDRKVADIPLDHPSCSKQHAVLQYRIVSYKRPNGTQGRKVIPYIVDLNSANGTFVNNQKIESQKYVQLLGKDVLKFGFSSREYVMLHDQSKEDEEDPGMD